MVMVEDVIGATRSARLTAAQLVAPPWKNPNAMQPKDFALLREAIHACGGTRLQPVLVRETARPDLFEVVDGLHRVRACREEGIDLVDVVVLSRSASPESADRVARLLQVGMNRMRGSLDLGAVAESLREVDMREVDASLAALSGFDETALRAILSASSGPGEEVLLGGSASSIADEATDDVEEDPTFELKVSFTSKKSLHAVRRAFREAGGGDLAAGAVAIVAAFKDAQKKKKVDGHG